MHMWRLLSQSMAMQVQVLQEPSDQRFSRQIAKKRTDFGCMHYTQMIEYRQSKK